MKYPFILFDLDGTLLNTLGDLTAAANFALGEYDYPPRTEEEIRSFVGNGVRMLMVRSLPKDTSSAEIDRCVKLFKTYYTSHVNIKTHPYPGILSLLSQLKELGVKMGVVSNKFDAAVKLLCGAHLSEYIDVAIGELPGIPKKPDPASVRAAMKELGARPGETLYVGDSETDLETAASAGLPCVIVNWGFRDESLLKQAGAELIISTPEELLSLL